MKDLKVKKVGILTGGGDCPGLNAVIRAFTKCAIHHYGLDVIGFEDGFQGLIEGRWIQLSWDKVSGILSKGGTILGTSNRANPFKYPLNKNGKIYFEDLSNKLIENIDRINIDALVCVGGDGTLKIAQKLYEKGLPIVGIPKTIDNDVLLTDVTFGFNSAVSTATDAIDKLHTTAASHHRVMIIEVMGRNAGWIALEAGIAGGADIILIPEIPYKIEQISKVVERRHKKGKRFSIIVVAEGARPEGGDVTVERMVKNADIPVRLGGISKKLCNDIEDITGLESRFTILGHLQRGGSPTPFDRILGTQFGTKASEAVVEGRFGMMTALQNNEIGLVPIKDAIRELKLINPEGFEVKMAKSIGTSFGV